MNFLKTRTKERTTYKYYDANRNLICELKPGEKGVTEMDIRLLHRMDDRIVDNNIKNCRPKISAAQRKKIKNWEKNYIQKFKEKNHCPPTRDELKAAQDEIFPKNWSLSLNQITDIDAGGFGDKSHLLSDLASNPFASESESIERLHEIVEEMPENWQEIYKANIEGYKNVEIAEMRGVTEGAIRKTLKKIKKYISKDPQLKKYCRRGTKNN